jgi:methionyl-tRNA formyltransferase
VKFVFFGTPQFAASILEHLIEKGSVPAALVTNPDRPAGRKRLMTPPATKALIRKLGLDIPVLQPEKINDDFLEDLRNIGADIFIVMAYGKMLPKALIDMPKYGTVNIHPSLLPKYRGPSPVQTAILNGETETGITLYKLDEQMDHGPMLFSRKMDIRPEDDNQSMMDRMALISADMVADDLFPNIDTFSPVPQNDTEATYTKKFASSDGYIEYTDLKKAETDDKELADILDRKIRALNPEPGCWTMENNVRVKLIASEMKDGFLRLKMIQKEGKKPTIV